MRYVVLFLSIALYIYLAKLTYKSWRSCNLQDSFVGLFFIVAHVGAFIAAFGYLCQNYW